MGHGCSKEGSNLVEVEVFDFSNGIQCSFLSLCCVSSKNGTRTVVITDLPPDLIALDVSKVSALPLTLFAALSKALRVALPHYRRLVDHGVQEVHT